MPRRGAMCTVLAVALVALPLGCAGATGRVSPTDDADFDSEFDSGDGSSSRTSALQATVIATATSTPVPAPPSVQEQFPAFGEGGTVGTPAGRPAPIATHPFMFVGELAEGRGDNCETRWVMAFGNIGHFGPADDSRCTRRVSPADGRSVWRVECVLPWELDGRTIRAHATWTMIIETESRLGRDGVTPFYRGAYTSSVAEAGIGCAYVGRVVRREHLRP